MVFDEVLLTSGQRAMERRKFGENGGGWGSFKYELERDDSNGAGYRQIPSRGLLDGAAAVAKICESKLDGAWKKGGVQEGDVATAKVIFARRCLVSFVCK